MQVIYRQKKKELKGGGIVLVTEDVSVAGAIHVRVRAKYREEKKEIERFAQFMHV